MGLQIPDPRFESGRRLQQIHVVRTPPPAEPVANRRRGGLEGQAPADVGTPAILEALSPGESVQTMKLLRFLLTLLLASGVSCLFPGSGSAQQAPPLIVIPDVGFRATPAEELPTGLHFGAEAGPTGGPYRYTEFFQGVTSHDDNGLWARRDNVWGLCFNLEKCTGQRILPDLHSFSWTWESDYQPTPTTPPLVENNFNFRYADGQEHRPWALHVWTEEKLASLSFSSLPDRVNFQINQNGNVVIGPPYRQPVKQLEVVGDAFVTQDVEVGGRVTAGGAPVLTGSTHPASGQLRWGISDGAGFATAEAFCTASRLACRSAMLPGGAQFECSLRIPEGRVVFALCQ